MWHRGIKVLLVLVVMTSHLLMLLPAVADTKKWAHVKTPWLGIHSCSWCLCHSCCTSRSMLLVLLAAAVAALSRVGCQQAATQ
jgi:hypothetical protein